MFCCNNRRGIFHMICIQNILSASKRRIYKYSVFCLRSFCITELALFRMAKHNYLFFQTLDNFGSFKKHCDFYLNEYSEVIPHSALKGVTPMEVYTSRWGEVDRLKIAEESEQARQSRKVMNLASSCKSCPF